MSCGSRSPGSVRSRTRWWRSRRDGRASPQRAKSQFGVSLGGMDAHTRRHAFRSSAAVLASLLSLSLPAPVAAEVAVPSITGPISGPGSPSLDSTTFSLAPFGYTEEEFFAAGMATGYVSDGDLSADGKWSVSAADAAGYTTRLLVRRPTARKRFNGTVVVEWLNVSGGFDAAPDWTSTHTMLLRDGFVWIGVSAQYIGVS